MKEPRNRAEKTEIALSFDSHVTVYTANLPDALVEIVERLETAEREDAEALALDMAAELGVSPSVVRGRLTMTRQRLDRELRRAEVNESSLEAREAAVAEVIEAAVVDLEELPAVKRSRQAAMQREKAPEREEQLRRLILAETPDAERAERERWPDGKKVNKTNVNKRIQDSLRGKGFEVGFRKIEKARAKR